MMLQFVMSQEHLNLVKHTTKSIQIGAPHTQPYPPLQMRQVRVGGPDENNTKKRQNDYYLDWFADSLLRTHIGKATAVWATGCEENDVILGQQGYHLHM